MQATGIRYSRPIHIDFEQMEAGDQVDLSATDEPAWKTVTAVTECSQDPEGACENEFSCAVVLDLDADGDSWFCHFTDDEFAALKVRLACS